MDLTQLSCEEFLSRLASKAPAPGGGGAAALVGAAGVALGNMVGNLTTGKKKYAAVEEEILALNARAEALRKRLEALVQADADAFTPLAAAYGLTRWRGRARSSVLLLYCLLPLLPSQVMLLPNYLICRALGLLNTQLAVVLLGVFSPLSVFLLARAMGRVGPEQAQAAALDGAGEWTLLRRIYLPQVRETALIAAALAFLDQWSMVELPLVLLSDEAKQPLSLLLARTDFPAPCAGAALYMLPVLVTAALAALRRVNFLS